MLDLVVLHHVEGAVRDNIPFTHVKLSKVAALETKGSGGLLGCYAPGNKTRRGL